jgi:hypothetical protein
MTTMTPAATRGSELRRGDDLRRETEEGEQRRRHGDGNSVRVVARRSSPDMVQKGSSGARRSDMRPRVRRRSASDSGASRPRPWRL